jgi:hypothetical protein
MYLLTYDSHGHTIVGAKLVVCPPMMASVGVLIHPSSMDDRLVDEVIRVFLGIRRNIEALLEVLLDEGIPAGV